ncbi:ABC transporter substrate-binding protein [Candidatus Aquiluna sp. UB-MaderosW2red]|uniref:ABC transporter substrate-binding protein n=1 Tax=Candidatus Aquiluna sp. UB-MaderosW2red TaxID=1855377 RepID=UPI000875A9ED|nr:ABC transporter substrate-binding protein [Candidatus Aquiluna sp. UB-MaderosW2red]SCX07082.1 branched-chain amino acid transport system substrate-binding protein [Candidatus Aquiluna sp. UB-MaderosW2red]
MTTKFKRSSFTRRALSAASIAMVGAVVLAGCATAEPETTETAAEETSAPATISPGGCELAPEQDGDLVFKMGTALPLTGNLAFLGPPEEAGVALAVDEVNAAGKGITIDMTLGDSGDTDNKAYDTEIPRLLGAGVQAIVGAASSGTSLQFIDRVIAECVIQFSPANTSAAFTDYEDKGLYFRTAPSDVLQGEVLGNLIAEDGHQRISLIVLNDSYGTGLASYVTTAFEAAGGEVIAAPTYNTGDTNFTAQIAEALAGDPDAIVLITFDEAKTIVPELVSQFPADKLYFVDGNLTDYSADFAPGTLMDAKGTYPGVNESTIGDFITLMDENWQAAGNAALALNAYGPESYDAVILLALAALEARSTEGANVALKLQEVSGGSGMGTKCTSFAECADIINGGGTADYDGPSGAIEFNDVGDPTKGNILIQQFDGNNVPVTIRG